MDDAYGEFGDTSTTVIFVKEPPFFRKRPSGIEGIVCSDLEDKPCDGCDGRKCVFEFINSCM